MQSVRVWENYTALGASACQQPAKDDESPFRLRTRTNRRGVTLVEMMVVVAIIGLIVSISLPSATAGLDSVRLSSATGEVSAFLNGAVNRAERRQQAIEFTINPKENQLAMYANDGFEKHLKLPDGIAIQAVLPNVEGEEPNAPQRLILLPGATVPGIGIQIGNQHGAVRIVRLDPMTGFPRVESVNSK